MNGATRESEARSASNELLLLLLMAGATMLFATFTSAYLIRRTSPDWVRFPLPPLAWIGALLLAAGSATMEVARRRRQPWLAASLALGIAFALVQAATWRSMAAAGVASSPHAAFFVMLTSVHAVHLGAGLLALGAAWTGRVSAGLAATWWHFIGGLWIYLLLLVQTA